MCSLLSGSLWYFSLSSRSCSLPFLFSSGGGPFLTLKTPKLSKKRSRERNQNLEEIVYFQKQRQHMEKVQGGAKSAAKDPAKYSEDLNKQHDTLKSLNHIVEFLAGEHSEASGSLAAIRDDIQRNLECLP